ncbi:hypothetical protein GCM10029964_103730 [Kibdelosporangium lantanae]
MRNGRLDGLCYVGPNLIPLRGNKAALRCFADRALRRRRTCSSLVGPADQVLGLWAELEAEWGPPREVRADQPLMAINTETKVQPDPLVRPVRPDELDRYLPAAIAMFIEEVGVDPRLGDGGAGYRARVAELIAGGVLSPGSRAGTSFSRPRSVRCPSPWARSRACGCTRTVGAMGWARREPPLWWTGWYGGWGGPRACT